MLIGKRRADEASGGTLLASDPEEAVGDGAFSRYFDLFTARPGSRNADKYGRFPIPGERTMQLPKGRVRIYFDMAVGDPGNGGLAPSDELSVSVVDEQTGEEVPIRYKLSSTVSSHESTDFTRTYVGRTEIPHEGSYKVSASRPGDYPEPHLSLGR